MPTRAPGNASPLSSTRLRAQSVDARASGLGAQSTESRDNTPVSGDNGTGRHPAEPPTRLGPRDLNPMDLDPPKALNAASSPALSKNLNNDDIPRLREVFDWSDSCDNGDLGDVPEYPVLTPSPIPAETSFKPDEPPREKGKEVDPLEKSGSQKKELFKDWLGEWTDFDENMAELNRPGSDDSDESLVKMWDDENRRGFIQVQNLALQRFRKITREEFTDKCNKVNDLQERVHELEKLVIQAQTREEMAQRLMDETHRAPTINGLATPNENQGSETSNRRQAGDGNRESTPAVKTDDPPSITKSQTSGASKSDTRYWRASSLLLSKSSVKRAIVGSDPSDPDSSDSSSESEDDGEQSSTESSDDEPRRKPAQKTKEKIRVTTGLGADEDSPDDLNAMLLAMEPESDHDSDSIETKRLKRAARHKHRAQLNLLKYQQGFLKHKPPFTYNAALSEGTAQGLYGFAIGLSTENDVDQLPELEAAKHLVVTERALSMLRMAVPLPTDESHDLLYDPLAPDCFQLTNWGGHETYLLSDKHNYDDYIIYYSQLCDPAFDIVPWLTDLKLRNYDDLIKTKLSFRPTWFGNAIPEGMTHSGGDPYADLYDVSSDSGNGEISCESCDEWVTTDEEGREMVLTDSEVDLPSPRFAVIEDDEDVPDLLSCESSDEESPVETTSGSQTKVLGPYPAQVDYSGLLMDFVSSTVVDQLKLEFELLQKPIPLQLAVSGSRSTVKATMNVELTYQDIKCVHTFDIANLESYDVILGMPFLYQHQVLLGFNPPEIKIRSIDPLPICGSQTQILELRETSLSTDMIDAYSNELCDYAQDICKEAVETPLPPL
ncbi:hypothetical protein DFJ58DRAFT_880844 [Suillus subalutaceus]|uniref:uncharacterized protein n=1 Tax=Suillus subalutaceus TaxID=48586 RepID=UPI001B885F80|nr:uncharacterized protein DFJ58DRAFT_880844 [Suillus subalutaceus]KAG1855335.1 hypothetical protein DFJ58DRAFT_880844 [Suillus subalutaceus]